MHKSDPGSEYLCKYHIQDLDFYRSLLKTYITLRRNQIHNCIEEDEVAGTDEGQADIYDTAVCINPRSLFYQWKLSCSPPYYYQGD